MQLHNGISINILNYGKLLGCEQIRVLRKDVSRQEMEAPLLTPLHPQTLPYVTSHLWLFLSSTLYNKLVSVSILSEFCKPFW